MEKLRKKTREYLYYGIFKFFYLAGLTFLIPFVLSYDAPQEVGLWHGTQEGLFALALFFLAFSIYGVYTRKGRVGETLRSLGWMSLTPGVFSFLVWLGGKRLLQWYARWMQSISDLQPFVDAAIDRSLVRVWYLIVMYIFLGIALLYLSKKVR